MGRWSNKYAIGLTGNIAMGKSVVRKMLEHLGAYTIDADSLAHQTMAPGAPAYHPIVETFGKWILDPDGKINRSKLGAVAFAHPEALARLEALTHPLVVRGIDTLFGKAPQPIVVIEAIKLLEGQLGGQVDAVWVVDSAPQVQIVRIMQKRGLSEQEARKRIEVQNSQHDKLARADVVISNNGSLQDVWVQVEREWRKIQVARGLRPTDDRFGTVRVMTEEGQPAQPMPTLRQTQTQPQVQAQVPPPSQPVATAPAQQSAAEAAAPAVQPLPPKKTGKTGLLPILNEEQMQPPKPKPSTGRLVLPAEVNVDIRRGMPKTAELIATLINHATGKSLSRMDIMGLFGEKSYLLAEVNGRVLGLAGFQVENLITRLDEFIIVPEAPLDVVGSALIQAVEDASKQLQSEVNFAFLPMRVVPLLKSVFENSGYEHIEIDAIKIPAWREAAQESQPPNTQIFSKRLRDKLVLKPV